MSLSFDAPGSTCSVRQTEWGGRRRNGHHMLHAPRRASCIGISQQWRAPDRWQFAHPSTSVLVRTADSYGGRSAAVVGPLFLAQSGILSPPSPPRLNSPHPSSMRTRAADRLLLGMRVAAPEEGAGTTRPSEIASRDLCVRVTVRPRGSYDPPTAVGSGGHRVRQARPSRAGLCHLRGVRRRNEASISPHKRGAVWLPFLRNGRGRSVPRSPRSWEVAL